MMRKTGQHLRRVCLTDCTVWRLALTMILLASPFPQIYAQEHETHYEEAPITQSARDHWSFRPIVKSEVPSALVSDWCRNPIDNFIERDLSRNGLQPQRSADRRTLIRRLSFDLTGLPPTPLQIQQFLQDPSEQAYEALVDRLLESSAYGERWAQFWLDLARFAETDGFEHDKVRKDAWKYRDWVIQSLNEDMPYDQFLRLQLAGDEVAPGNEAALTATRFCLSGPDMPDINLIQERRHAVLNELTSTVGEVVLGLQIGCAQCHDHMYDPISQADFYRMRAIFQPAVSLVQDQSLSTFKEGEVEPAYLMLRGDFRQTGPQLAPGVVRVVSCEANPYQAVSSQQTAGLRTGLANWLTSRDNPLTARVIVNRIWQHHFGKGLVASASDFGSMGDEPSHPELLDWLAASLMEDDWHLKSLHRRIVLSATYRQQSRLEPDASQARKAAWSEALSKDPDSTLYWRYPGWRLEGEAIRDAMLLAAGQLNPKAGGPGVRPPLPKELVSTLLTNQWQVTEDVAEHNRRSIYVFARRNLRYPIFEVFDRPSANASCAVRSRSTTAPQSLHLLNSGFSLSVSRVMAQSICEEHQDRTQQVSAVFQRALSRLPTEEERQDVEQFLAAAEGSEIEAMTHLCLSLFNTNEFVFVD